MSPQEFSQQLLTFLDSSPTPFHATANLASALRDAGFSEVKEADAWSLEAGKGYYITRNDSSIIAWRQPEEFSAGLRMVGAHTDSPCLKVKPSAELNRLGYQQLGVEVYGGALLNPWFDRDLSIAGRVSYRDTAQQLGNTLINFTDPVA